MKSCLIVAAGSWQGVQRAQIYQQQDFVIAADRGLKTAAQLDIPVDLLVGDFDSYTGTLPAQIPQIRYPAQKDDTDTMIAIKYALEHGCSSIKLLGVTGGRFDHTMATIQSLCYIKRHKAACQVFAPECWMTALSGEQITLPGNPACYLGVFALTERACVTLQGVKYPLQNAWLTFDFPLGVSNEFAAPQATIEVSEGIALAVVCPKDAKHTV